ncbi:MAG TPA: recombinase family protein [Chakrabartia sp.]|jgi:DNA invertase Pin-like site-specific DNA recombinase|nr:recombinase family protein [Chakrabartia sp.]
MASDPGPIRCAVYTRKSTEEGLQQAFNSLDAQREACVAYIASQKHEGWQLIPDYYDDGGFSGGSMARPALKALLDDIEAGKVDVIVVYKVDRLTRSLADFAKIVEILDAKGASFVSVTQSFNTTSSMGRLTLNVLLSFAQFEREVTGERIRDKVAASRARGMWMGGCVPTGYNVVDRKLVIEPAAAQLVKHMFRRYLELGSVTLLADELDAQGHRTPIRTSRSGRTHGGVKFSRGMLYQLLRNRTYIGEVTHKGSVYPGEHDAIIDRDMFEKAATFLTTNASDRQIGTSFDNPSLLAGIIWSNKGHRLIPSHSVKRGKRYRYYAEHTAHLAKGDKAMRMPAGEIDGLIMAQLDGRMRFAAQEAGLLSIPVNDHGAGRKLVLTYIERIVVGSEEVTINFRSIYALPPEAITIPAKLFRNGKEMKLAIAPEHGGRGSQQDPALIQFVVRAHIARTALEQSSDMTIEQLASHQGYSRDYYVVLLRIAHLAPDITSAILDGRQPATLNRQRLARIASLPMDWQGQRAALGFA